MRRQCLHPRQLNASPSLCDRPPPLPKRVWSHMFGQFLTVFCTWEETWEVPGGNSGPYEGDDAEKSTQQVAADDILRFVPTSPAVFLTVYERGERSCAHTQVYWMRASCLPTRRRKR